MKARFKTILLSALGAITAFSAVTLSSCSGDKCKAIVCAYNGVCTNGQCLCPSGYEGPQCETITRERYLGIWNITEDGTYSNPAQYAVSLEKGPNITEVIIKNFRNRFVENVQAFVKGDTLTIPNQTVNGNKVYGYGYITDEKYYGDNGKIIMHYTVTDENGNVDDFGVSGGDPSLWVK